MAFQSILIGVSAGDSPEDCPMPNVWVPNKRVYAGEEAFDFLLY
jgi:hypothetical protein